MTEYAIRHTRKSDGVTWVSTPDTDGDFSLAGGYANANDIDAVKAAILEHNAKSTYSTAELLEVGYTPVPIERPLPTESGYYVLAHQATDHDAGWVYRLTSVGEWFAYFRGTSFRRSAADMVAKAGTDLVRLKADA